MKIPDPELAPDVSLWCDHINARELEDGGCTSIVVGLYPITVNGKKVLNPICRKQCIEVATHSSMVLQAYYWDDITKNAVEQADWLADTLATEGLPIKWVWADQEQWWSDWAAWYQARRGEITWDLVPRATPANISIHNLAFSRHFHEHFPAHGVYTNRGFVSSWAAPMDTWLMDYKAWVPHYGRQPSPAVKMTWSQLKESWLPNYNIILSAGQPEINVMGHQFTGDACILPGSYTQYNQAQPLDVNVFRKTFIDQLRGGAPVPNPFPLPPPQPAHPDICPTCLQAWPQTAQDYLEYIVTYTRVNVRDLTGAWLRYAVKDEIVKVKLPIKRPQTGYIQLTDAMIWEEYIKPKG